MIFHFPQKKLHFDLELKIDNISISRTEEFDFLGLRIQENLNWNPHMNKVSNKLSRVIGIFKRLHRFIPSKSLLLMYNSLFLSHLNYCILAWGFSCNRLFSLQKKAVRLICHAKYIAHTDPLFKKLNLLKIQDIFRLKALKFYFRYIQNQLPGYFQIMFSVALPTHSYYTHHRDDPSFPMPAKSRSEKCIRYFLPQLLRNLPPCIIDKIYTHSYYGFSRYTKMFFVNKYLNVCTIPNCYVCNNS